MAASLIKDLNEIKDKDKKSEPKVTKTNSDKYLKVHLTSPSFSLNLF
jgi:hypothetical protein